MLDYTCAQGRLESAGAPVSTVGVGPSARFCTRLCSVTGRGRESSARANGARLQVTARTGLGRDALRPIH